MLGRSDNPTAAPRLPEGEETGFVWEWPARMRAEEKHEGSALHRGFRDATLLAGLAVASDLLNAAAMTR